MWQNLSKTLLIYKHLLTLISKEAKRLLEPKEKPYIPRFVFQPYTLRGDFIPQIQDHHLCYWSVVLNSQRHQKSSCNLEVTKRSVWQPTHLDLQLWIIMKTKAWRSIRARARRLYARQITCIVGLASLVVSQLLHGRFDELG